MSLPRGRVRVYVRDADPALREAMVPPPEKDKAGSRGDRDILDEEVRVSVQVRVGRHLREGVQPHERRREWHAAARADTRDAEGPLPLPIRADAVA